MNRKNNKTIKTACGPIPIAIGITGHRDLRPQDIPVLKKAVHNELAKLKMLCPNSPLVMLTCLAEGADQLAAEVASEEGIGFYAVLPMEQSEYEKDFKGDALTRFRALNSMALESFVVPVAKKPKNRDMYYRLADIYVSEHCHILLALWDGNPGSKDGCGAAETVDIKLKRGFETNIGNTPKPDIGCVCHIMTKRMKSDDIPMTTASNDLIGNVDLFKDVLKRTDRFNYYAAKHSKTNTPLFSKKDDVSSRIKRVYEAADLTSIRGQKGSKLCIALIAVFATLLTTAFLLYDEVELHFMIVACIALIFGLFCTDRIAKRFDWHTRYTDGRLLAEELRVQDFCYKAGMEKDVADLLPWAVWTDAPWTVFAIKSLTIGKRPPKKFKNAISFISGQKAYHEKALRKTTGNVKRNNRIMKVALVFTLLSYVAGFAFELFFGGSFPIHLVIKLSDPEFFRTLLKIVMGILSAATLFAGSYYGKLSVDEEAEVHERMAALCSSSEQLLREMTSGNEDRITEALARELVCENASWYNSRIRNKPEMSL